MRGLLWSVVGATFLACTPAPPDDGTGGGSGGGASCQVTLSGANPLMGRCELDPFYVAPDSKVSITLQGSMASAQLGMTIPGELAVGTWTGGMGGVTCVATSGDATGTRGWSTNIMGGMNSGACSLTITSVTSRIDTGVKRYSLRGTASATLVGGGATAGTTTTLSASF